MSPVPNSAGWNRTATTVTFACTDEASGIASCAGPATLATDGTHQATGTATDNAGNVSAPVTVLVNLDGTAPTLGENEGRIRLLLQQLAVSAGR